MDTRLMTGPELVAATGRHRYSKQAEWFKTTFGIDVVRNDDGHIVMTWSTFDALIKKKAGITESVTYGAEMPHIDLCFD
ncbi:DUF4224 domain-containing protein [Pararobbsia silviterrae]|uniref:DUF4224 domain-containing protein n=1 Tax=Pararobbsia silviterrae TaxID=1792498 RepID=A0A494Y0W7_9BURK|nr:DUF4224 domain-containing protein [Pararobbsia silviterrae]RKP56402.1 DUF4224 domain-containing protein [Pararobbsia silviterrae]